MATSVATSHRLPWRHQRKPCGHISLLNKVIDTHWAEVAGSISVIEAMYEDEFFAQRELAALLASKVRHSASAASRHQRPVLGDLSRVSRVPRSET